MDPPCHSAIVKCYKEDLCTISGPLERRERCHELFSRFHLFIEYTPGTDNHVGDALLRWSYPAGTAHDTNFHGAVADLAALQEEGRKGREYIRQNLQDQYPQAYAAVHAVNCSNAFEVKSKLQLIRKHMQFWATYDPGRELQSSGDFFYTDYRQCRTGALSRASLPPLQYAQ